MSNIKQLQAIETNIRSNIESIQRLVSEAEDLKESIGSLEVKERGAMEKHLVVITDIINNLTKQTIEMFSAFREFVK